MRRLFLYTLLLSLLACNQPGHAPDVSGISIRLKTERFEQDFFRLDSASLPSQLEPLLAKYPTFGENFMGTILNTDPRWPADTMSAYVGGFMNAYRKVYDTAMLLFRDFKPYEEQISQALKYVKYYFPAYKVPEKIITYIGPLDGYGDILSEDALIVGLHHHLGAGFSLYRSEWVSTVYPEYITRRFEPGSIAVNAMTNIIGDLYPEKDEEKSLVLQMIERGKRLYLLSLLLPGTEEHTLIGYTKKQLSDCYDHEAQIWDLFLQNNLLRTTDNNIIKNYIGESPKTQELGDASPGNIGSFCGWQIVKKYMAKKGKLSPEELMKTDDEAIFQESKYKP